jgi:2-polyprenyl-6-hydroxyphenyl methylase/3-demethylubiquinone-9 3-methyltransferase
MRNDLTIYDKVADRWWSDDLRWVRTLKNLVPGRLGWFDRFIDWPEKDVLDLGCAGGFMAEAMATRGANVTGIDPAAEAIAAARSHARASGLRIAYDIGVGEELPYADASFDAVICVDVLEHVRDLGRVLAEVARVLRPGGLFLFDTINRNPVAHFVTITIAEDLLAPSDARCGAGSGPNDRPWPARYQPALRPHLRSAAADRHPLHGPRP